MSNEITIAITSLAVFQSQILQISTEISNLIVTEETMSLAKELTKKATNIVNEIEKKRKEYTEPLEKEKKKIIAFANELTDGAKKAISEIREKLEKLERTKEINRRTMEKEAMDLMEKQRKKAEELLFAAQEKAKYAPDLFEDLEDPEIENLKEQSIEFTMEKLETFEKVQILQEEKSTDTRKVWQFRVISKRKIPLDYLIVDNTEIRKFMNEGIKVHRITNKDIELTDGNINDYINIPGIEFYSEIKLSLNSRGEK